MSNHPSAQPDGGHKAGLEGPQHPATVIKPIALRLAPALFTNQVAYPVAAGCCLGRRWASLCSAPNYGLAQYSRYNIELHSLLYINKSAPIPSIRKLTKEGDIHSAELISKSPNPTL